MSKRAIVRAEGAILGEILSASYDVWNEGLSRAGYERYFTAQRLTPWGGGHLERFALVERDALLASAKLYHFDAVLDARPIRIVGLGAVFTQPAHRGRGAARELIERLLERSESGGADLALLFSEIGPEYYARLGFTLLAADDLQLRVAVPERRGAPMTMVRSGDDRDLDDLVAMGRARAEPYRCRLERSRELIQYAIAKRRLLAGLGPPGEREVRFVVAEEGATAAAYVLVTAHRSDWSIDECGDRDPAGARVGAILQVLLARDPAEHRPAITARLPHGFLPPQLTVIERRPATDAMMCRPLSANGAPATTLEERDVLYWRSDMF